MGYSSLTVFFEDPFWVGVYERTDGGRYEACKITFGAEPKDYEVWDFLLKNWGRLRFSPSLPAREPAERKINPKRMQRTIHSQLPIANCKVRGSAPRHSRRCNCSVSSANRNAKPSAANSARRKRSVATPCASKNAGKSTGDGEVNLSLVRHQ